MIITKKILKKLSGQTDLQPIQKNLVETNYEIGDRIVVRYDDNEYVGEVTEVFLKWDCGISNTLSRKFSKWPDHKNDWQDLKSYMKTDFQTKGSMP